MAFNLSDYSVLSKSGDALRGDLDLEYDST
jgi:hypothetical protein